MPKIIEQIEDNEHFEFTGDVQVTGNIGKNATVVIKDGSLTVAGDVGDDSELSLTTTPISSGSVIMSGSSFFSGISIGNVVINGASPVCSIHGKVGSRVTMKSHNAEFSIDGSVGDGCTLKTHNGDIRVGNVGESSSLTTHNGTISCGSVGKHTALKTHNGDVHATEMGEHTRAISHNGDVRVSQAAPKSAELETHNGSVYEAGVKRRKPEVEATRGVTISSAHGITFMSGARVSGRIIINGKDVTDLVNGTVSSTPDHKEPEKEPVRFKKA